ncbi:helicase-associated domain-containing protein [Homoserinibacter sp. YIM 151385]|uniref:helicase-associated domain-containing protein n=1 Tax=Homoserinibacter sp. YIM 151385 TaxID=2985506 RepID=UPI0022F1360D|nr:helicase-associated domain-containing protein [Homoserinibacter sp. YIM 151385]WBU37861.1 helicase-associated domain-containing protein [Homoserinibacter sp. YIM 151385]
MPSGSSSALALAARLRALDDDALRALIESRRLRSAGIRDWFDLAEALLERAGVQSALERLDRRTLAVLGAAAEHSSGRGGAATARELAERVGSDDLAAVRAAARVAVDAALLGEESGRFAPWDAVIEQLAAWPSFGLPALDELLWRPPPAMLDAVAEPDERAERGAGERAFHTASAATDLVLELRREPGRRLAKGGLALPDARRIAAAAAIEADDVPVLLELAARAGIASGAPEAWVAGAEADAWLDGDAVARWARLAEAWLERLPDDVRELLSARRHSRWGDTLREWIDWSYPAGGAWMQERVETATREAELLGLVAEGLPSGVARVLLEEGAAAAGEAIRPRFPAEVDRVYLQHDLTVISPGPLQARLDARLRQIADAEGRGLASSYRVTAASLSRALAEGWTAEGIRAFMEELSLTGVPQPLDYLLRDTAGRFGSLRVSALPLDSAEREGGMRTAVRAEEPALIDQLAVDQALGPIGLRRTGPHRLLSRVDPAVVFWSLVDARYPAIAEDEEGRIVQLRRDRRRAEEPAPAPSAAEVLVARLRESTGAESGDQTSGEAWIARQLELAAKSRTIVAVTVRMPDGGEVELRLEPSSVAGGRLRGRDARADLERTLPLSSITAVATLD